MTARASATTSPWLCSTVASQKASLLVRWRTPALATSRPGLAGRRKSIFRSAVTVVSPSSATVNATDASASSARVAMAPPWTIGPREVGELGMDARDRGGVGVVVRAHARVAGIDRLSHGFVLERASDPAAAHAARCAGVRGPRNPAHYGAVEDRGAHNRISVARDPVPVHADGGVVEPKAPPLVEGQLAPWNRGGDVLLGLDHHLVELLELLGIGVLADRMQLKALPLHLLPAFLARGQDPLPIGDQVQLGHAHPPVFAITDVVEHPELPFEVLAHSSHRSHSALAAQPVLANPDQVDIRRVVPQVIAQDRPDGAEAFLVVVPMLV